MLVYGVVWFGSACDTAEPVRHDTPMSAGDSLNFLVIGDWGRGGNPAQLEVAAAMASTATAMNARFVVTTGDNFYDHGVRSITDEQWLTSFERVYSAPSLQIPWYVTLGNHDYHGNVEAQIMYTSTGARWTLPGRFYALEYRIDAAEKVLLVFLDTVALLEEGGEIPAVGAHLGKSQLVWLDSTLTSSDAGWKLVFGHHPAYSASTKHEDSTLLISVLAPLIEKAGVQAYTSGHVHSLQHIRPANSKVHYFISGAGSEAAPLDRQTETAFAAPVTGFMTVTLTAEVMEVGFVDRFGARGYQTRIPRSVR